MLISKIYIKNNLFGISCFSNDWNIFSQKRKIKKEEAMIAIKRQMQNLIIHTSKKYRT